VISPSISTVNTDCFSSSLGRSADGFPGLFFDRGLYSFSHGPFFYAVGYL
jgi:hypothetical protein